ncbi:MAG: TIGR03118 family protein [Methylococcaceae bacterium]|nr:TIGR03118 family protein [Methylococcaceae bacterium]
MKELRITVKSFCAPLVVTMILAGMSAVEAKNGFGHEARFYQQRNLVSDGFIPADHNDPNLVNAWGVAFNPLGPVWVADNGTGTSTLYDGDGIAQSLVVSVPSPNSDTGGNPTGVVFNPSAGFTVSNGGASGASRFIFATEDGVIAGWAPNVPSTLSTRAIRAIDHSAAGAVYKGLAIIPGGWLYAADFHNNKIDVFDSAFTVPTTLPTDAFTDPMLPAGYGPFGLQAINGEIYVSYAKQDGDKHDDVKGKGFGFINVFDPNGRLVRRLVSAGKLNAPWGMALAPAGFGKFSGRLLVGNFGDGRINAFDLATGEFVGQLRGVGHRPIQIDGLWGIAFGNGFRNQPANTLFFAAGPGDEAHGLYGRIDPINGAEEYDHYDGRHANDD